MRRGARRADRARCRTRCCPRSAASDGRRSRSRGIGLAAQLRPGRRRSVHRPGSSGPTTTTRSRASRSSTRNSSTTSRTRRTSLTEAGASSRRSACSRSCPTSREHEPGRLPQPAARAVLRLGVRRHVLQREAHRPRCTASASTAVSFPPSPSGCRAIGADQLYKYREREDRARSKPDRRALLDRHADSGSDSTGVPGVVVRGCGLQGRRTRRA